MSAYVLFLATSYSCNGTESYAPPFPRRASAKNIFTHGKEKDRDSFFHIHNKVCGRTLSRVAQISNQKMGIGNKMKREKEKSDDSK